MVLPWSTYETMTYGAWGWLNRTGVCSTHMWPIFRSAGRYLPVMHIIFHPSLFLISQSLFPTQCNSNSLASYIQGNMIFKLIHYQGCLYRVVYMSNAFSCLVMWRWGSRWVGLEWSLTTFYYRAAFLYISCINSIYLLLTWEGSRARQTCELSFVRLSIVINTGWDLEYRTLHLLPFLRPLLPSHLGGSPHLA